MPIYRSMIVDPRAEEIRPGEWSGFALVGLPNRQPARTRDVSGRTQNDALAAAEAIGKQWVDQLATVTASPTQFGRLANAVVREMAAGHEVVRVEVHAFIFAGLLAQVQRSASSPTATIELPVVGPLVLAQTPAAPGDGADIVVQTPFGQETRTITFG